MEGRDSLGEPDLIILPGTKTTMADLAWLRERGFAAEIRRLAECGTPVIGICGGYQMMGRRILDPHGVESPDREADGLQLLPVDTVFAPVKETHRVKGSVSVGSGLLSGSQGAALEGYEIHMGSSTHVGNLVHPFSITREGRDGQSDGALSEDGRVLGTYIHGLFNSHALRRAVLETDRGLEGSGAPAAVRYGWTAVTGRRIRQACGNGQE